MKSLLILSLLTTPVLYNNNDGATTEKTTTSSGTIINDVKDDEGMLVSSQPESGYGRMRSIEFKAQEYCRAELENFEFDVQFKVVSATVYFSGAGFTKGVEKGTISSNSLKPIKSLMDRCMPGTIVVFDDVKVIGPDKMVRTIQGMSLILF